MGKVVEKQPTSNKKVVEKQPKSVTKRVEKYPKSGKESKGSRKVAEQW